MYKHNKAQFDKKIARQNLCKCSREVLTIRSKENHAISIPQSPNAEHSGSTTIHEADTARMHISRRDITLNPLEKDDEEDRELSL